MLINEISFEKIYSRETTVINSAYVGYTQTTYSNFLFACRKSGDEIKNLSGIYLATNVENCPVGTIKLISVFIVN